MPRGSETPYALHVDRRDDTVWICGTNSDTLIRFEPASGRFTVYPLPTQVTYTRDIDFDDEGGVWTSNSNAPTWQIETGVPRVLRLDPGIELADDGVEIEVADIDADGHEDVVAITDKSLLLFRGGRDGIAATPDVTRPAAALTATRCFTFSSPAPAAP